MQYNIKLAEETEEYNIHTFIVEKYWDNCNYIFKFIKMISLWY